MEFREVVKEEEIKREDVRDLFRELRRLAEEVYSNLGAGFPEEIYQKALQIEMRNAGIRFQREVHIEIFYKGVPLGFDRPDFIIRPFSNPKLNLSVPVIVELKTVKSLNDKHRTQVKTYLRSIPHASDEELRDCKHAILINFPDSSKSDIEMLLIEASEV